MYELVLSYWLLVVESFSTYYHLEYELVLSYWLVESFSTY